MTDRFAGTKPDPVARGAELDIVFENPALGGQNVTITIADVNGSTTTVDITLDAAGKGSRKWLVPAGWGAFATLEHPTSEDHPVAVTGGGESAKKARAKKKPAPKKTKKPFAKKPQRG